MSIIRRTLVVDGIRLGDLQPGEGPDLIESMPEKTEPFSEREQVALLERRLDLLSTGGVRTADVLRTELLDSASRAISAKRYDVADSFFSVVVAIDMDLGNVVATYLRELLIEAGQEGLCPSVCTECGCTDGHACPGGCCWIEPGLCSRCADKLLDRTDAERGEQPY